MDPAKGEFSNAGTEEVVFQGPARKSGVKGTLGAGVGMGLVCWE